MPNGDGPWTKFQAPAEAGPWTKYAPAAEPSLEIPDPVKQAQAFTRSQIKPLIPGTGTIDPSGGLEEAQKTPEYQDYMKASGRMAAGAAGGMAGGALISGAVPGAASVAGGNTLMRWLLPKLASSSGIGMGAGVGELAAGATPKEALATAALGTGTGVVLEGAGAGAGKLRQGIKALTKRADPLARINKILGVEAKGVRVGTTPETMDAFVTNPARGVSEEMKQFGIDEKAFSKMNPLERNKFVTEARNTTGKKLDAVLDAATQQGKKVSIRSTVDDIFKEIPDKNLQTQTRAKLGQIVNKAMGRPNVFEEVPYMKMLGELDNLTPTQAREIQRGLDDFANFADEGPARSFKDVATQLRRGISRITRQAVPESAPFDQQYGDLANATKATQRQMIDYVRTTPQSKLRGLIKKGLYGAGGVMLYEGAKHMGAPLP